MRPVAMCCCCKRRRVLYPLPCQRRSALQRKLLRPSCPSDLPCRSAAGGMSNLRESALGSNPIFLAEPSL